MFGVKKSKSKIKNPALYFCFEGCKDSKTVLFFVPALTVNEFYYFKGENITFYRRSNKSSENAITVRLFPPVGPVFCGLQLR